MATKAKKRQASRKVLYWLGIGMLVWGGTNTGLDILRYGIAYGHYWWFCNLALMGMGYGLVMEDRGLITGFLAIASFTQTFWLIDNLWVLFGGTQHFGLVDYLYQPGYPMDEFILSHYHYFTFPIGIAAMAILPASGLDAVKKSMIFNPIIFGVSYFAFSADRNVNCIHHACFPGSENTFTGIFYSLGFWLSTYVLSIGIAYLLERYAIPFLHQPKMRVRTWQSMTAATAVFVLLFGLDVHYKAALPKVVCTDGVNEGSNAGVSCAFITLDVQQELVVTYRAHNPSALRQLCRVEIQLDSGERELLHEELPVDPFSQTDWSTTMPKPAQNAAVAIHSKCKIIDHQTAMLDD